MNTEERDRLKSYQYSRNIISTSLRSVYNQFYKLTTTLGLVGSIGSAILIVSHQGIIPLSYAAFGCFLISFVFGIAGLLGSIVSHSAYIEVMDKEFCTTLMNPEGSSVLFMICCSGMLVIIGLLLLLTSMVTIG